MYIRRTRFTQGFIQNSSFHCAAQEEEEKRPSRGKKRTRNRRGLFSLAALIPAQNQYYSFPLKNGTLINHVPRVTSGTCALLSGERMFNAQLTCLQ